MRILTILVCLLITACTVQTTMRDGDTEVHERFGEWNVEDAGVDNWVRRWMDRDRTVSFDVQVEQTFGGFYSPFDPPFGSPFASPFDPPPIYSPFFNPH